MRVNYILSKLRCAGIDCYSSWLEKSDGTYLIARIEKMNNAIKSLIPIDDNQDDNFIQYIIKTTNPH